MDNWKQALFWGIFDGLKEGSRETTDELNKQLH